MTRPDAVAEYLRDPRHELPKGMPLVLHVRRRRAARRTLWRAVLAPVTRDLIGRRMLHAYREARRQGASRWDAREAADTVAHVATLAIVGRIL